jgi:elongation factor P--(R)-beta-lysine ligase
VNLKADSALPNSDLAKRLHLARMRAHAFSGVRAFFAKRGVLEVDTPILSQAVSHDCHIDFFEAGAPRVGGIQSSFQQASGMSGFLQTSPEPHMKRLLCSGFGDIFQISKAFRWGEAGKRHNPEFTMLEWYRRDFTLAEIETETLALCQSLISQCSSSGAVVPVQAYTWEEAWQHFLGFSPLGMDEADLRGHPALEAAGIGREESKHLLPERGDIYDFLMAHAVEPRFDPKVLTVVRYFPIAQAAQSLPHPEHPQHALRFEVYGGGFEIANGYQELRDAGEYRQRFMGELSKRQSLGKPIPPLDQALLEALDKEGLPACSGVAVGFDRLLMFALGHPTIAEVILFPWT